MRASMAAVASIPAHCKNSSEHRSRSRPGTRPTSSTDVDVGALAAAELADFEARVLDPGAVEVDEVHRHLRAAAPMRASNPSARTPGSPPSVRGSRRAMRRATVTSSVVSEQVDRDEWLARADRSRAEGRMGCVGTEVGCAGSERVPACAREIVAGGVGVVVEEDRHAWVSAHHCPNVAARPRAARSRWAEVPASATKGTTSSAPRNGCTPSCPSIAMWRRDRVGELRAAWLHRARRARRA